MCWDCWVRNKATEEGVPTPVRILNGDINELNNQCCFCNRLTIEGIYVRLDPKSVELVCKGEHKDGE